VPVVAGHGAEELHLFQLAPGGAAHHAAHHGAGHGVVHHVQAGVAVDNDLIGAHLHHVGHQLLAFLNAVQHAIVPAVGAVLTGQVAFTVQHIHHAHGKIQLRLGRLAPGHVQRQLALLIVGILRLQRIPQRGQLLAGQFGIRFHSYLRLVEICKFACCVLHNAYMILRNAPNFNGHYPQIPNQKHIFYAYTQPGKMFTQIFLDNRFSP